MWKITREGQATFLGCQVPGLYVLQSDWGQSFLRWLVSSFRGGEQLVLRRKRVTEKAWSTPGQLEVRFSPESLCLVITGVLASWECHHHLSSIIK